MEQLLAVLDRIATALEKIEETGVIVLADADNIADTLKEVRG